MFSTGGVSNYLERHSHDARREYPKTGKQVSAFNEDEEAGGRIKQETEVPQGIKVMSSKENIKQTASR